MALPPRIITLPPGRRVVWVLTTLLGVAVAGAIILLWLAVLALQTKLDSAQRQLSAATGTIAASTAVLRADTAELARAQASSCRFNRDLGSLTDLQSQALTVLIGDARLAFRTRHCAGQLPPPTPSFVYWARFYHLPVIR